MRAICNMPPNFLLLTTNLEPTPHQHEEHCTTTWSKSSPPPSLNTAHCTNYLAPRGLHILPPMVHQYAVLVGHCTVVVLGVSQINHWELYLLILHERPVALSPPQAMTRKILKVKVKMLHCGWHTCRTVHP